MLSIINKKRTNILITLAIIICLLITVAVSYFSNNNVLDKVGSYSDIEVLKYYGSNISERFENYKQAYLSDMTPIEKKIGWRDLALDSDTDGNPIILLVEGNYFSFQKGLFAHASSTLVYDLTEYDEYSYFTTFIGLNNTSAKGNGVIYHFYTSEDGNEWTEAIEPVTMIPKQAAIFIQIPLEGVNYLKLVADSNGGNASDHSVYADAKLVTEVNGNFILDSLEELDDEVHSLYNNQTDITGDLEHTLLKRELVNRVGQYTINSFYNESEDNEAMLNWLLNNKSVLNYYIMGGKPTGNSYYNSLTQLSRLYKEYYPDFAIQETTKYGTVLGELYTRMAISLSLTHSGVVGLWMDNGKSSSDAVRRYAIVKYMHKNELFKIPSIDYTAWFERYTVEEMRYVMANNIDDESMLWLNSYVRELIEKEGDSRIWPHKYIAYVWPNYSNPIYYAEENKDYFNQLFSVRDPNNEEERIGLWDVVYTVPGGVNVPEYKLQIPRGTDDNKIYRVWMNMRNKFGTGAVCGGISKVGSNIRGVLGLPDAVVGQPGHAAHINYFKNSKGEGFWGIDNDVSGWVYTGSSGLLGWANAPYASGYTGTYIPLAQEVVNHFDIYEQSQKFVYLADTFTDLAKKEEMYRKALEIQPLNLNAWYALINTYNASSAKTEDQYYDLAERIAEVLKCYPLPMYQMTNLIKPKLTSVANSYRFTLLQTRILKEGSVLPNSSTAVLQPSITRLMANYLLGVLDSSIATFSFDGAVAGKIVLSSRFDGNGVRWDYSLDGKNTWNEVSFSGEEEHKLQLTKEQIESITSENDIYVHIVGVNYDEKNLYKIDITEGTLPAEVFANDLENRVVGVNLLTEWRYTEEDSWTSYSIASPELTGDKTIQLRQAANGTKLASPASPIYKFTEDNQPDTRKYIPVSHLNIHEVSTEATAQNGQATKAIDGNYNTRYHSAWNGTDTKRYITIKLDKPVVLSAIEFVPYGGGNGKIYDGTVYGSMDGENWEVLSSLKNIRYTNQADTVEQAIQNIKCFDITSDQEVQYVKIVADRSNGNWFAARAFNFYQDLTKNPHPTAGIAYSTTEMTNGKVVARLINPSTEITITNNGGSDTYVFSENGEFTFEFQDAYGTTGSATAKVNWIDKSNPDADVNYEVDSDNKISISLDGISEDVYLLDKDDNPINFIEVKNKKVTSVSYLNSKAEVVKTVYVDENGCITKISYVNTNENIPSVATYVTIMTDGAVSSEEYYDSQGIEVEVSEQDKEVLKGLQQAITDPLEYTFEESGSHEFKLLDKAENIAYKSVKVDYDEEEDKIVTSDITYDITHLTNKNVVATINAYVFDNGVKKDATIVSGNSTHTFEKNGKFSFQYRDKKDSDDDLIYHIASVSWIDKDAPTAEIKYTTKDNGEVVATLTNESEEIIILNNSFSRERTFKENGEFTFVFEDKAGNEGRAIAKVDSIKEEDPDVPVVPDVPDVPVEPDKPTDPDEPSATDPSSPVKPSKPVIPFNPSKPNNITNTDTNNNQNSTENDTNETPTTDETTNPIESEKPENNKPIDKDINDEDENQEEKNKSIITIILILIVIALAVGTVVAYIKNKNKEN